MTTFRIIIYIILALATLYSIGVIWAIFDIRKKDRDYFKGTGKVVLILCASFLFSCNAAKHYQRIHGLSQSGTYTIKTRHGDTTTLKGLAGKYMVPSDTLKVGDKITITTINRYK